MAARPGGDMAVLPPSICQLIIGMLQLEDLMVMRLTSRWFHAAIRPLSYEDCLVVEKTLFGVQGKPQSREGPFLTCFRCIRIRPRRCFVQSRDYSPEHLVHCDTCEKCRKYASRRYCDECRSSPGRELAYHPARKGEILVGTSVLVWCNLCGALDRRGGHRWTEWKLTCASCVGYFRKGPWESWVYERLRLYRCTPSTAIFRQYTGSKWTIQGLRRKWAVDGFETEFETDAAASTLEMAKCTALSEASVHRQLGSREASLLGLPTELQNLIMDYLPAEGRASLRITCFWFMNLVPPLSQLDMIVAEFSPFFIRLNCLACLRCHRLRPAENRFGRSCFIKSEQLLGRIFDSPRQRPCFDCATSDVVIRTGVQFGYRPGNRVAVGDRLLVWCMCCRKVVECDPSFSGQLPLGRNGGTGLACEQCEAELQESGERYWLKPRQKSISRAKKIERKGRQHLQRHWCFEHGILDCSH